MSLYGKHIVITRASHQATELAYLIEQAGAIPVLYPCIDIAAPENTQALDAALVAIDVYDWIIFSSTNTVHAIQARLHALELPIDWTNFKIAAVGDKTGNAIEQIFGRDADFIPTESNASRLADELPLTPYQQILLPQSALADDALVHQLTERGAIVTRVEAYTNVIGTGGEDVPALIQQNQIDAITFTSASTVTNFVQRIAPIESFHIPAICIGSSTYDTAIEVGFQKALYPDNYTISDMLKLLNALFEEVQHGNT